MAIGMTAPAFPFLKKGASGFRSRDLTPVATWEMSVSMRRSPVRWAAVDWRFQVPVRVVEAPGNWTWRSREKATPSLIDAWPAMEVKASVSVSGASAAAGAGLAPEARWLKAVRFCSVERLVDFSAGAASDAC